MNISAYQNQMRKVAYLTAINFESNGMEQKLLDEAKKELEILEAERIKEINSDSFMRQ